MPVTLAPWVDRSYVLIGRCCAGILPLALFSFASRTVGLEATGTFATAFAIAAAVAELADIAAQRHVPRLIFSRTLGNDVRGRLKAFHGLRVAVLLVGIGVGAVVLGYLVGFSALPASLVTLVASVWLFLANTLYAHALAQGRFALLAAAPLLGVAVAVICAWALPNVFSVAGVWPIVLALHAGKITEASVLLADITPPRFSLDRVGLKSEWRETRYLMWQALLSSANARLVVPLASALTGALGAALFSISVGLLSIVSLFSLAIALPSYRSALSDSRPQSVIDVFRHARRDWTGALLLSMLLSGAIFLQRRWVLKELFHVDDPDAEFVVALVVLTGAFEALNLFAGTFYHACFMDLQLFRLSAITMSLCWSLMIIGGSLGSLKGVAWGFFASRAGGALVLYGPLMRYALGIRPGEKADVS